MSRFEDLLNDRLRSRYRPEEYPAVLAQAEDWRLRRPLAGMRIFDATPLFWNTLTKHTALLAAGAELTVGISDVMPFDPDVADFLRSAGIRVAYNEFSGPEEYDAVLDCTGAHREKKSVFGYVELTRSGIHRYRNRDAAVFAADSSRIKEIETALGTGEGCFRALHTLGYDDWNGRAVLLFGYGKVGRGIAFYFHEAGAHVSAVDDFRSFTREVPAWLQKIDCSDRPAVRTAIEGSFAVVSATGIPGALSPYHAELAASGALLVNMGAEDEYGADFPADRVLNSKKPLNFLLDEPTLLRYIDPSMALHNAGAEFLINNALPCGSGFFEPPRGLEAAIMKPVMETGLITDEIRKAGLF